MRAHSRLRLDPLSGARVNRRRLSLQVGGAGAVAAAAVGGSGSGAVANLARDMERLKVSPAANAAAGAGLAPAKNSYPGGASPRPLKRKSSRRSSKSGIEAVRQMITSSICFLYVDHELVN
jgi:hypothetical protein